MANAKSWSNTLADMRLGRRNARVLVKEVNRHIKSATDSIAHTWATGLQTYDPITEDGKVVAVRWRNKRPDELPENDPKAWEHLAEYARAIAFTAKELERFAEEQKAATRRRLETYEKDVHTEHCCSRHGCKYGDADCPVSTGAKPQSFACEACDGC